MNLRIRPADLTDARDADSIAMLLNAYAIEPVGGGKPLPRDVQARGRCSTSTTLPCFPNTEERASVAPYCRQLKTTRAAKGVAG
jgi:hypothetical protein